MEKKLSYGMMLSLKEISLRKVTVILWTRTDILALVDTFGRDKVKDNTLKLELPSLLAEQIKYLVQPIGWEIRNWKWFHAKYLDIPLRSFDVHILEQLCWTNLGTVDYRKTAENLICLEMLDIVERYRLACTYCLDYSIPALWGELPEWKKEYFSKKESFHYVAYMLPLEFCWSYILKGEESLLDNLLERPGQDALIAKQLGIPINFNQYAFKYSTSQGNKEATEFFFQKLAFDEREILLLKAAKDLVCSQGKSIFDLDNFSHERHSDTFRYLLSLMSVEQQMEILKKHPCKTLMFVLDWPWQHNFWDVAVLVWPFLTKVDYVTLLKRITIKIVTADCPTKLFQEFFLNGSSDFRKYFVDKEFQECHTVYYFSASFDWMDSDTIKSIFKAIESPDRKKLASSRHIFNFFYESLSKGKYHFVEQCLQEATISKEEKEELKEAYFQFLTEIDTRNVKRREEIWNDFLHFLE